MSQNTAEVNTVNSSTTPLADAGVFTGIGQDISQFSTVTVFVDTDIDGTLSMQFSSDNSNWDRAKVVTIDQDIASGSVHTLEVVSQFFRVVYTNSTGNGAQSHFRLQTIFHKYRSGFLTSSPDQIISKLNDAQIMRIANDPYLDISRSLYADKYAFHRFGFNGTVPNGSFADVWAYGPTDATYNWPTTDETFRVAAGGNAADDSDGGAGARTIQIVYLDANGNEQQDQLTLAGASASDTTTSTGRRVIRAWVDTCGTIESNNTGEIIIENSSTNQVVAVISAGVGQTQISQYTVPLGYTAYLTRVQVNVSVGTNKDADVRMWQRQGAYTTSAPFGTKRIIRQWLAIQGDNVIKYESNPSFPALTDLWFEAQGNGATTAIDVDYDLICVKDEAPTAPQ